LVRVLGDSDIRLSAEVSDPHGIAARAMIDCLLDGGTPQQALLHAGRLKVLREALAAALDGELSAEHLIVARLLRRAISMRWRLTLWSSLPGSSLPGRRGSDQTWMRPSWW
jgi:hypothetical protein